MGRSESPLLIIFQNLFVNLVFLLILVLQFFCQNRIEQIIFFVIVVCHIYTNYFLINDIVPSLFSHANEN